MKKLLLGILALVSSITFLGCGVEDQFKADPDSEKLSGVLTEQKLADEANGTHFLTTENGDKVSLRSLQLNLSSEKYLDNKVEVTGFMNEKDGVFEVTMVNAVEVLDGDSEAKSLVEYQNDELGLKLKHFSDWEPKESVGKVSFLQKDQNSEYKTLITIELIAFDAPALLEDEDQVAKFALVDHANENLNFEVVDPIYEKIGVDGLTAMKLEDAKRMIYLLYRPGFIYEIILQYGDAPNEQTDFKQVLADLQVIPFSFEVRDGIIDGLEPIEDIRGAWELPALDMPLTSFESLPYSFKGKYPASWYYAGSKIDGGGVLHHYGFSKDSLGEDNEMISLDILAGSIPSGKEVKLGDKTLVEVDSGDKLTYYFSVAGQNYRISGTAEYKNLLLYMAAGIEDAPEISEMVEKE